MKKYITSPIPNYTNLPEWKVNQSYINLLKPTGHVVHQQV